ncbi:MAG: ATP-binding cassette domain-containing protein [bacterium]
MQNSDATPLLQVSNLKVHFSSARNWFSRALHVLKAVDDVSFVVLRGSTVGLVGESGSGKTTIGRAITRLEDIQGGSIQYEGREISRLGRRAMFPFRKKIQMIFQDPYNSLNPRLTILSTVSEPLEIHFPEMSKTARRARVTELLEMVGLEKKHLDRYPHEFSGGQRQRIGIARALAVKPEFIICDEPVSALDVSVQAQIINLLQDLQQQLGLTYLFIAHDLAVVEHISDEVLVMQQGKIVEQASAEKIYHAPQHEYTRKLLAAVPQF